MKQIQRAFISGVVVMVLMFPQTLHAAVIQKAKDGVVALKDQVVSAGSYVKNRVVNAKKDAGNVKSKVVSAGDYTKDHITDVNIEALPGRFAFVSGDYKKFQAHQWMEAGYVGGIKDLSVKYVDEKEGITADMEAGAIIDEYDYKGAIEIEKEEEWFAKFEFSQFPKYFSDRGGVYYPFPVNSDPASGRDLRLDIGKFAFEAGLLEKGNRPEIIFEYEHEKKNGDKSSTAWTSVTEGGIGKKIGPAFREITENVDDFNLNLKKDIKGYTVKAGQNFEIVTSNSLSNQQNISSSGGNKAYLHTQDITLQAKSFATNLGAERWFLNEKVFSGAAYKYARINNREKENMRDVVNGAPSARGSTFSENKFNARANNSDNSNLAVLGTTVMLWKWLIVNGRLKGEIKDNNGFSTFPSFIGTGGGTSSSTINASAPDGIIDHTEVTDLVQSQKKLGEGLSLRFKAIPRTALYGDVDLEQVLYHRNSAREPVGGQSPAAVASGESIIREVITHSPRFNWTIGGNYQPWMFLNSTAQFRYKWARDNINNHWPQGNLITDPDIAFYEDVKKHVVELTSKTSVRPCRLVQSSFRYQLTNTQYFTTFAQPLSKTIRTQYFTNVYTIDTSLYLRKDTTLTGAFSKQNHSLFLPSITFPTFNTNSNNWMLTGDYHPNGKVSIYSTLYYSIARNYDNFTGGGDGASNLGAPFTPTSGLPLGADFTRTGITVGVKWSPKERITVSPQFAFYRYNPNHKFDLGGYEAYVGSLEISYNWA